jgi:hypothetical protein
MESQKINGTNCYNCIYISRKAEPVDYTLLNHQGGLNPQTQAEMKRAQKADLITLPGGSSVEVISKQYCNNQAIEMYVTIRMCCAYWDSPGVIRPWKNGMLQTIIQ